MPVHDWNRVEAGTFHAFHTAWITHLSEQMNGGILPDGYYALPEQHAGRWIADVLKLQAQQTRSPDRRDDVGVALADAPPQVRQRLISPPSVRGARRTLTIRHVSGHATVALMEIVSPANKDRSGHVSEFVDKAENALALGIHLMIVDLFAPGPFDPMGMHGALWDRLVGERTENSSQEPLTIASYRAGPQVEAFLERLAMGRPLPTMPLFLSEQRYVNVPLEATYSMAFAGLPAVWRHLLEEV